MPINDSELRENLQAALDEVYVTRPVGEDDSVKQCKNCFTYEGHSIFCIVPTLEKWIQE